MERVKQKEWSYVAMLWVSIIFALVAWRTGIIRLKNIPSDTKIEKLEEENWVFNFFQERLGEDTTPHFFGEIQLQNNGEEEKKSEESVKDQGLSESTAIEQKEEQENKWGARQPFQAKQDYFDDALFIGDSRTVGLMEYGSLGEAEVLADSGMSVYEIRKKRFSLKNGEKLTLDELLQSRQFGKVYLMLGINELGYDFEYTVKRYRDLVTFIREHQTEAIIFLQANLHITNKKSGTSPYYNNDNIDRFNEKVKEMAGEKGIFYLDINPLFDDEDGGLNPEITTDDTHILGKYYQDWVDWLLTQAR